MNEEFVRIEHLTTSFRIGDDYYAAVDNVSLTVRKNEILAIVGESGSGKSALAFSIMGLHTRARIEGSIIYDGQDIAHLPASKLNQLRGKELGMIFQDPLSALNPLMVVGSQIDEVIYLHHPKRSAKERKRSVMTCWRK